MPNIHSINLETQLLKGRQKTQIHRIERARDRFFQIKGGARIVRSQQVRVDGPLEINGNDLVMGNGSLLELGTLELDDQDVTPVADRRLRVIDGLIRATDTSNVEGEFISAESIEAKFLRSDESDTFETGTLVTAAGTTFNAAGEFIADRDIRFKSSEGIEGVLTHANTVLRTYTFPNQTGTVELTSVAGVVSDAVSIQWEADPDTGPSQVSRGSLTGFELPDGGTKGIVGYLEIPLQADLSVTTGADPILTIQYWVHTVGTGNNDVDFDVDGFYISDTELVTKALDQTVSESSATIDTLNELHTESFTLTRSLITAGDRLKFVVNRDGSGDAYDGAIAVIDNGTLAYRSG